PRQTGRGREKYCARIWRDHDFEGRGPESFSRFDLAALRTASFRRFSWIGEIAAARVRRPGQFGFQSRHRDAVRSAIGNARDPRNDAELRLWHGRSERNFANDREKS